MRAVGKGFQEFIERAKKGYGVRYIRARPGLITENAKTKKLTIWYEDETVGKKASLEVDMVVLSTALTPKKGTAELAKILGIEVDEYGFMKARDAVAAPVESTRVGIFIAGYCESPKDIPESVAQASGAAARVAEILAEVS